MKTKNVKDFFSTVTAWEVNNSKVVTGVIKTSIVCLYYRILSILVNLFGILINMIYSKNKRDVDSLLCVMVVDLDLDLKCK